MTLRNHCARMATIAVNAGTASPERTVSLAFLAFAMNRATLAKISVCFLLFTNLACVASPIAGTWGSVREIDGQQVSYEVDLSENASGLFGVWSTEGSSSATGCLHGKAAKQQAILSLCILDGSRGARDSNSVCPNFDDNKTRFVLNGTRLLWETRNSSSELWQPFLVMERTHATRQFRWPSDCGSHK